MAAVGADHEQRLAERGLRKGLGAYYTPPDVVDGLLDVVLTPILAARAGEERSRPSSPATLFVAGELPYAVRCSRGRGTSTVTSASG